MLPCYSASLCKFSLKSDNRLLSYDQITIFKMAAVHHLEFLKFSFVILAVIELQICCCVPNFIQIE